jgi:hypothetical protein
MLSLPEVIRERLADGDGHGWECVGHVDPLRDDRDRPVAMVHIPVTDKGRLTLWLTVDQRSVLIESEVLPAPESNDLAAYEFMMTKNRELFDVHFARGRDGGIYLVGRLDKESLSPDDLDRVTGASVRAVEENYSSLVDVAFPHWRRPSRRRNAN